MALVDQYGKPIKSKPETKEIAVVSVRDRWSSYPSQRLTPEKLATVFKEADGGDVYRQSELFEEIEEKDTHLSSILQTRKNSVLGLDWEILPAGEDEQDQDVAAYAAEIIYGLEDFEETILDLLDAIAKGFAVTEIMWQVTDGKVGLADLKWRHQKKFRLGKQNEWRLVTEDNYEGEELPENKFMIHCYRARSGHPTRSGVLRVCAWMYLFKNYSVKDWVSFAEVYGMPLRLGKYDANTSPDDKEVLMQALMQLGTDAAGIISKSTEIEFIDAAMGGGGSRSADLYENLAEFCNREMSKAVLGQTLTTDVGSTGSYAASKTHGDVRQDLIEADCKALAKTIRKQLFAPLVMYNFGPGVRVPHIKFAYEPPEDLKASAETYATLVEKVGLPMAAEHLYEKFGIPVPDPKKETIIGGQMVEPVANKEAPPPPGEDQDGVDQLARTSWIRGARLMSQLTATVQGIIADSDSFEEIESRLMEVYQEMDADELEDLIAKALFVADMMGRWSADG